MKRSRLIQLCIATVAIALVGIAQAQVFGPKMKKPSELIQKQAPLKVNQPLLAQATD